MAKSVRSGGWVVPLDCESPLFQLWLRAHRLGRGVACELWPTQACSAAYQAPVCDNRWVTPLTVVAALALCCAVSVLLALAAWRALWRWATRSSAVPTATLVRKPPVSNASLQHPPAVTPPAP